ncbi:MAG TPA: DNA topoisomerase IB [Chthoniobacterales bacterium]|nr:DNA topoisomerase IB [Chthoniobacterales bacterium]
MRASPTKIRKEKKKIADLKIVTDPAEAAEEAGLRYVNDNQPGYTRKPNGDDFEYFDTEEKPIRDEQRLLRVKRLAIPPAWTDVWICTSPNGHVQAIGRDARGRKQYRYHDRWREVRDENKYDRIVTFGNALPKIRRRVKKDLGLPGLPRNKVLATVVQLLERTFIRIGNEEYARDNKSFGLTTMQDRHVDVKGSKMRFRFRGKSGRNHEVDVTDRHIAKIVSKLQDLPGQGLFQCVDDDGAVGDITSQDVNAYLREITGEDFSAKDFRTWAGTVLAAIALNEQEKFETKKQAKTNIKTAIRAVAKILGNTPAICRKCYVHPAVLEAYLTGNSIEGLKQRTDEALEKEDVDLRSDEAEILKFLQARLAEKGA